MLRLRPRPGRRTHCGSRSSTFLPIVVRPFGRPGWCGKFAVIAPAPTFVSSPISASPMYERCGTFVRSPMREFLISTNVPAFASPRAWPPGEGNRTGRRSRRCRSRRRRRRCAMDLGAGGDPRAAAQQDERMDRGVGSRSRRSSSIHVVPGVDDRDAREHVPLVDPVAQHRRRGRELDARVHAVGLERRRARRTRRPSRRPRREGRPRP